MMENAVLWLLEIWSILGRLIAVLAVVVFLLSLEGIVSKAIAMVDALRQRRTRPSMEMLQRKTEDLSAVLIPVLEPAPLAGAMLAKLRRSIDFENYVAFVAVKATDSRALSAVRREMHKDQRLHLIMLEGNQGDSLAHSLNAMLSGIESYENDHMVCFQSFVLHAPEAIMHPLALKLFNWHGEFASIVQLPVHTGLDGDATYMGGAASSDLGSSRAAELQLRARTLHHTPVEQTGIAFTRRAIAALKQRTEAFDTSADHPIVDAALRLNQRGHLSSFVWHPDVNGSPTAIQVLAPRSYSEAVARRVRFLMGTARAKWRALGTGRGSGWSAYFSYRDRRPALVATTTAGIMLTGFATGLLWLFGSALPVVAEMPRLIDGGWIIALLAANGLFLAFAVLQRMRRTAKTSGLRAALASPVTMAISVMVAAHALVIASRSQKSGGPAIARLTEGEPKPEDTGRPALLAGKPTVTDILVHAGMIDAEDAAAAREYGRKTRRQPSLAVQDLRLADGPTIAKALSQRLELEFAHLDGPLDRYNSVFLSRLDAERFSAFAHRADDGSVDVYVGEEYSMFEWRALRTALKRAGVHRPNWKVAPLSEVAYAIRFAGTALEMAVEQAIAVSLMDGPIMEGTERDIRRQLRGSYRRLEDMLIERGLVGPERVRKLRQRVGLDGRGLKDEILGEDQIPPLTLAETVREFNEWKPAIASLAPVYTAIQPRIVPTKRTESSLAA